MKAARDFALDASAVGVLNKAGLRWRSALAHAVASISHAQALMYASPQHRFQLAIAVLCSRDTLVRMAGEKKDAGLGRGVSTRVLEA